MPSKFAPSSHDLIEYIAENEPLSATQKHFRLTRQDLVARLRGEQPQPELPLDGAAAKRSSSKGFDRLLVYCDGASRGNPGPAGAGAVVFDASGNVVARLGRFLGETTNNVAEYQGLILGLSHARELGARKVDVSADSELLVKQIKGEYRVKNPALKKLHRQVQEMLSHFEAWSIRHVYREQNSEADEMSNRAIDERL